MGVRMRWWEVHRILWLPAGAPVAAAPAATARTINAGSWRQLVSLSSVGGTLLLGVCPGCAFGFGLGRSFRYGPDLRIHGPHPVLEGPDNPLIKGIWTGAAGR